MAARAKRTPEELRAASDHLAYEVGMFDATAQRLMAGGLDLIFTNALLESFTVHTRVLLQFLIPTKPRNSHVLADDFFADDLMAWRKVRGGVPKTLAHVNRRVGAEIAHLTYDRQSVTPEAKFWNVHDMRQAMIAMIEGFRSHVRPEYLGAGWPVAEEFPVSPVQLTAATNAITMVNSVCLPPAYSTKVSED